MQKLTERQVRHWIDSLVGIECLAEDCERAVSPVARIATLVLVDVPYVETHNTLEILRTNNSLRKFRAFLDEVVRVMDDCGVKPWTDDDDEKGR